MKVWKKLIWTCGPVLLLILSTVAPVEAGLVSHYTMDGIATDAEGVQDGVLNGGPSTVVGKIGTAISFNAGVVNQADRTQNMSVADPGNGAHTPDEITLSAWVNTTDGGAYRGLVDKIASSSGALLDINGGSACLVIGATTGVPSLAPVNDGAWHLITGTFADGTATLYVDGVLQGAQAESYTANDATPLNIAGDVPVNSTWALEGVVDDVGLWNDALSASEVGALYGLADTTALNYHLGNAQQLFDLHDAGSGSVDIGGQTWHYTTGLGGPLGGVVDLGGDYALMLDASGTGVTTVPEPSMIVLLMLVGLTGLLRRRN